MNKHRCTCPQCHEPPEVEEHCFGYDKQTGIPSTVLYCVVCPECSLATSLYHSEGPAWEEFEGIVGPKEDYAEAMV